VEIRWLNNSLYNEAIVHQSVAGGLVMRLTRTLIIGGLMVIPGLFLGLLVWYLLGQPQDGESQLIEIFACNLIPLASIGSGLFFGWVTGSEYAE
jgi:hypothetical protein